MAEPLVYVALILTAFMATAVVLTRDPARQAIVLSGYGLVLGILFVVLQAPDVAMSQAAVGTVVVPLIVILAIHAIRRHHTREPGEREEP
jgi:energy-converting hydrogenase B subunit D